MNIRIVIVTSGQPSANPRVVKEAITLYNEGCHVKVIYTPISPWADGMDKVLFNSYKEIEWVKAGWHIKEQFFLYKWGRFRRKWNEFAFAKLGQKLTFAKKSISLFQQELEKKAICSAADIYIAHNLAALPAAIAAARKNRARVIFDAEDYHRGEVDQDTLQYLKIKKVEDYYLPMVKSVTVSSPLINREYEMLFPQLSFKTILNVFTLAYQQPFKVLPLTPLKLVWFSQTVGLERGLQDAIHAISLIDHFSVHLTIIGQALSIVKNELTSFLPSSLHTIQFLDPMPEDELFVCCSEHHIGLALEINQPFNRELCLTNKIFSYLLAGNALVVSETLAQKAFVIENPSIGFSYPIGDSKALQKILCYLYEHPEELENRRRASWELGATRYNWEKEQELLVNHTLNISEYVHPQKKHTDPIKEKVLFIANSIYRDKTKKEGGVRFCMEEYIALIEQHFETVLFPVNYNNDFIYRLKVRTGLNAYNDYSTRNYEKELQKVITQNDIRYVFLNLSNTVKFGALIKQLFGDSVKIILCSHGNESGDYLHEITRFKQELSGIKNLFSSLTLGQMLKTEALYRQKYVDMVLTVSPVEEEIENWLGVKKVMMVPRTITLNLLHWTPVRGRVGFMGDLSHWPNFFGIDTLCSELVKIKTKIEIRLLGSPEEVGKALARKYSFVNYRGFLDDQEIKKEAATWCFFLNPVFYYSKGVSTKLAKALGWGLPVITTSIGCRGYLWENGSLITVANASEMAKKVNELSWDMEKINSAKIETDKVIHSSVLISDISDRLKENLQGI